MLEPLPGSERARRDIGVETRFARFKPPGASKIGGNKIIRAPASANIDPRRGGTYQITIEIKRIQKAGLIAARIRLNSPQCVFAYKK
jgi:hypothetical protein